MRDVYSDHGPILNDNFTAIFSTLIIIANQMVIIIRLYLD